MEKGIKKYQKRKSKTKVCLYDEVQRFLSEAQIDPKKKNRVTMDIMNASRFIRSKFKNSLGCQVHTETITTSEDKKRLANFCREHTLRYRRKANKDNDLILNIDDDTTENFYIMDGAEKTQKDFDEISKI